MERPQPKKQGEWYKRAGGQLRDQLLCEGALPEEEQVDLRSAGGVGAGGFFLPDAEGLTPMPDGHFLLALRGRLRLPVCPDGAVCQHRRADGSLCGPPLDRRGRHAKNCGVGASQQARHDGARDWSARTHQRLTGMHAATEQRVPQWDRFVPCDCEDPASSACECA